MADDLPYKAEYAKSGRASCKTCKEKIDKEVLRLAVMVQSPMFDGKTPHWYHGTICFWTKQRPSTIDDIAGFDSLRWEDQEKLKKKLEEAGSLPPLKGAGSRGGKGGKGAKGAAKGGNLDFAVEYAKSGASACKGCEEKIPKGDVRISKKDYEGEKAKRYGPIPMWHHVDCFISKREELAFFEAAETLPGFGTLSGDDKNMLKAKIKKIEGKRKAEDVPDGPSKKVKTEEDEQKRKQNDAMYKIRDKLKILKKAELAALLEHNDQEIPPGEDRIKDRLADFMTFGVPLNCDVCNNGGFVYKNGFGYACQGSLSEWTKCTNVTVVPKRKEFKVPNELREAFPVLQKYKFKGVSKRIITIREVKPEPESQNGAAKIDPTKPLGGMKFVIVGDKFETDKQKMKDKIAKLGGEVVGKVDNTTAAVITTMDQIGGVSRRIESARENNIQCVSEDFLEEVEKGGAILMIQKKSIAPWGGDPTERVFASKSKSSKSSQLESMFTKSMPATQKIKLKGGAVVDADSKLEDKAHVYQRGSSKIYNAVLGATDISKGTNSYYKLQLLESDNKRRYWVFRSWGRIGTTIGGNKLEDMEDLTEAQRHFEGLFEEKTGNRFSAKEFKKVHGRFHMLDIDYGDDEEKAIKAPSAKGSKSKLDKPIQELVSMVFDIDNMKKTMVEFEIDLKKMPLGKISKKQIAQAYKILGNALDLLKSLDVKVEIKTEDGDTKEGIKTEDGAEPSGTKSAAGVKAQLLDCSNRFYTLIPHDFGMKAPPLLDSEDLLKSKISMLESLSEIELAYNLLKSEDEGEDAKKDDDPIDKYYRKLKTKVEVVDKTSKEFEMLQTYVKNTHAATHTSYTLDLEHVFKVERQGERKRYKPFKALHNRQLLWHGSRLTNWAGILSQGLRIAPPEAPVTGYMFGKGVYFADMVSKSANYCCTNRTNNTALLLLAEVAMGNMYERKAAEYVEKLPKGTHSCKGLGKTQPEPADNKVLEDGTIVPLGKGVPSNVDDTSLLYNEFIVYDVAQINAKYLLRVKFNYK